MYSVSLFWWIFLILLKLLQCNRKCLSKRLITLKRSRKNPWFYNPFTDISFVVSDIAPTYVWFPKIPFVFFHKLECWFGSGFFRPFIYPGFINFIVYYLFPVFLGDLELSHGQGRQENFWAPGQKETCPPPPILQIMILKLSPPRCAISKESVQQKWIDELWFRKQLSTCLFVWTLNYNNLVHLLIDAFL
jgi:hypothetical protein